MWESFVDFLVDALDIIGEYLMMAITLGFVILVAVTLILGILEIYHLFKPDPILQCIQIESEYLINEYRHREY